MKRGGSASSHIVGNVQKLLPPTKNGSSKEPVQTAVEEAMNSKSKKIDNSKGSNLNDENAFIRGPPRRKLNALASGSHIHRRPLSAHQSSSSAGMGPSGPSFSSSTFSVPQYTRISRDSTRPGYFSPTSEGHGGDIVRSLRFERRADPSPAPSRPPRANPRKNGMSPVFQEVQGLRQLPQSGNITPSGGHGTRSREAYGKHTLHNVQTSEPGASSMTRRRNKERSSSGVAMRMRRLPAPSLKPKEPTDRREMEERLQQYILTCESGGEPVNEEWVNAVEEYLSMDPVHHHSAEDRPSHANSTTGSCEESFHSFSELTFPTPTSAASGGGGSPAPSSGATTTNPSDFGSMGKISQLPSFKHRGTNSIPTSTSTPGVSTSVVVPTSPSGKSNVASKSNRRGQASTSSVGIGGSSAGALGGNTGGKGAGEGSGGDLTSWAVAEAVLEKMAAFCRQRSSAIRFKRDVILQKRQDVTAAVKAFQEIYNELLLVAPSSAAVKQKVTGKENTKGKGSKGRHFSPVRGDFQGTEEDNRKLEKLKADAEKLTAGLHTLQLAVVQLLLRLQDYAKEVRKPLGVAASSSQEIRSDYWKSPSCSVNLPNTSLSALMLGMTSGLTSSSTMNYPSGLQKDNISEQDPGFSSFADFVTHQEREIAQQLRDVQNKVEGMLAKNSFITIEDTSILQTPLFCSRQSLSVTPSLSTPSSALPKTGVSHDSLFQPSRPLMSKASDRTLGSSVSSSAPLQGKLAVGQGSPATQPSLVPSQLEQEASSTLRGGPMWCPLFTVSTSVGDSKAKKSTGVHEQQDGASPHSQKERVTLVLSSAAPSVPSSRTGTSPLLFPDIQSPSKTSLDSPSAGKALSMTKPKRSSSSKHQRRSQSVSYQGSVLSTEGSQERSVSNSYRVGSAPGGVFSLLSKAQLEQARHVWNVVSTHLASETSETFKDEKDGDLELEKTDTGKRNIAKLHSPEQLLSPGREGPKRPSEAVGSLTEEKPKDGEEEKKQGRDTLHPSGKKKAPSSTLAPSAISETKATTMDGAIPSTPEATGKKGTAQKGAVASLEEKKKEPLLRTLPPTPSLLESGEPKAEEKKLSSGKGKSSLRSPHTAVSTREADISPTRQAREKPSHPVGAVVSPTRGRQKEVAQGQLSATAAKSESSRHAPVSPASTSPRARLVSHTTSPRSATLRPSEKRLSKTSTEEGQVLEVEQKRAAARIAAWWKGCRTRRVATTEKMGREKRRLHLVDQQRRLVAGRCIFLFWTRCKCKKQLKETLSKCSGLHSLTERNSSSPLSPTPKGDGNAQHSASRDRFLRAKEQRRALNAELQQEENTSSSVEGVGGSHPSPDIVRGGGKVALRAPISVADVPAVAPVTPLPLLETGISTTQITRYYNDSDSFDLRVLHRLCRAPTTLVYLLCVLTLKNPHYPPMGYAPMRDGNTPSFEALLAKVRNEHETLHPPRNIFTPLMETTIPDSVRGVDKSFLIPYPQLKKLHPPFFHSPDENRKTSVVPCLTVEAAATNNLVSMAWSPRYRSYVVPNELRSAHPVVKDFKRPFERWGISNAFVRRLFTAAAIYSWKLIFSHTPHDDFKQRQLQSPEQRASRLDRVDQRNRMILACYCVHSEREWLREASKDISFVGQIWNPKRSLDQNDPDLQRHAKETFDFVEDFLYQCFPTVSGLDEVPSFLLGAGIFFLLRESLNYNEGVLASHVLPWGHDFLSKPSDFFSSNKTDQPLSSYAQTAQQKFELCDLLDRVVQQESRRYRGKPTKVFSSSSLPPPLQVGDTAEQTSVQERAKVGSKGPISVETPTHILAATQATPRHIFSFSSFYHVPPSKDASAQENSRNPAGEENDTKYLKNLALLRVPVGPSSEKLFSRDFEESLLGYAMYWVRQCKEGSPRTSEGGKEHHNFFVLYPRKYLVTLSQTLAKLLFGLQLELDVCEELDCLD